MAKSVNKFIVKLSDVSEFKPKLAVAVTAVKDKKKTFLVKIVHPNFKVGEDGKPLLENGKKIPVIVHEEEFKSKEKDQLKGFLDAIAYGKQLMEKPEIQEVARNTKYVEQLFIPQGKRGKMKLKTRESVAAAEKAEAEALRLANNDEPMMDDSDLDYIDHESDRAEAAPKAKKVEKKEKVLKPKAVKKEKVEKEAKVSKPKKVAKVKQKATKKKISTKNKKKVKVVKKDIKNKKKKGKR